MSNIDVFTGLVIFCLTLFCIAMGLILYGIRHPNRGKRK